MTRRVLGHGLLDVDAARVQPAGCTTTCGERDIVVAGRCNARRDWFIRSRHCYVCPGLSCSIARSHCRVCRWLHTATPGCDWAETELLQSASWDSLPYFRGRSVCHCSSFSTHALGNSNNTRSPSAAMQVQSAENSPRQDPPACAAFKRTWCE